MTLRRRSARRRGRSADQTPACAERDAPPTSPGEHLTRLLSTWPGTLRLVLVLAVAVGLLVGVMLVAPVQLDVGPVQIAPAAPGR